MNANTNTNNNAAAGNEDYLDKGLDAVEKKFGGSMGSDPNKNRGVNEKIVSLPFCYLVAPDSSANLCQTDGARNMFEKATGKNVPSKFSN